MIISMRFESKSLGEGLLPFSATWFTSARYTHFIRQGTRELRQRCQHLSSSFIYLHKRQDETLDLVMYNSCGVSVTLSVDSTAESQCI